MMILESINRLLDTTFKTEQEALELLVKKDFAENHANPARRFLEIYEGIFNNLPKEDLFREGLYNVNLMAEASEAGLRSKFYAQSVSHNIYTYDRVLQGLDLKKIKREFDYHIAKKGTISMKKRAEFLTYKISKAVAQAVAFQGFLTSEIITEEGNELIATYSKKNAELGTVKVSLDFFEDGLTAELPRDIIYALILTVLNKSLYDVKQITEEQAVYLQGKVERMQNPFFNTEWEKLSSGNVTVDIKEFKHVAQALGRKYLALNMPKDVFTESRELDSELAMRFLAVGLYYRDINTLSATSFVIFSMRKLRTEYGIF